MMMFDQLAGSFCCILYKILFDCVKNNEKHQTSQNKKRTTQPSIIALGIRIKGPKFILKRDCLIFFCISAIMLNETKILEKNIAVKRRWCQHVRIGYCILLSSKIFTLDGHNLSNFQWLPLVTQRPLFWRSLSCSVSLIDFVFNSL